MSDGFSQYESDALLEQYLAFHWAPAGELLPWDFGPKDALDYAVRTVNLGVDLATVADDARALDIGCAVGRSTFELARHCTEVIGIDLSRNFIGAARQLVQAGGLPLELTEEGRITRQTEIRVPADIDRSRLAFEVGDACDLRDDLGVFDVVHLANLIDRLPRPEACLLRLAELVAPSGQAIIASPYTWLEDFTPADQWVGGWADGDGPHWTLDGLRELMEADFELEMVLDLPFLIREHRRKYQWSVGQLSRWRRRE